MPQTLNAPNMMRPGPRADTADSAEIALARTDPCNMSEVDGDPFKNRLNVWDVLRFHKVYGLGHWKTPGSRITGSLVVSSKDTAF